jgi:hypothetical protein
MNTIITDHPAPQSEDTTQGPRKNAPRLCVPDFVHDYAFSHVSKGRSGEGALRGRMAD